MIYKRMGRDLNNKERLIINLGINFFVSKRFSWISSEGVPLGVLNIFVDWAVAQRLSHFDQSYLQQGPYYYRAVSLKYLGWRGCERVV